ncbi:MAG: hypothetical protein KDJ20_09240 [Hyphomicrobiales bacterium]|nr:hypothetical protein [Hyphomicrobiales bacterium]MCC2107385.1 hypothetical protein [Hyphomicrobiales bacterium]
MPYTLEFESKPCPICSSQANIRSSEWDERLVVDCCRCGDFAVSHFVMVDSLQGASPKFKALASYQIRRMQSSKRPYLGADFFRLIHDQALPAPSEAMDNLLTWLAGQADGMPGKRTDIPFSNASIQCITGVVGVADLEWVALGLTELGLITGAPRNLQSSSGSLMLCQLTPRGWEHYEELQRANISSRYAFFARKFSNSDLDLAYENCLRPAVKQTGYELRTVTQRAGLIDAQIEDEIRRCKFLLADLSDDNAGAYWEAGFAEGLRKPVIYVCRAAEGGEEKQTHFDANHRHTIRWDLQNLDETSKQLKAVIRNTLLGDAIQTD